RNADRCGSNEIARAMYMSSRIRRAKRRKRKTSDVEVGHAERVLLDELTTWLDLVAHQRREDVVRRECVFDPHLHEPAARRIDGRLPELLGIHLAKAFVALDRLALARLIEQPLHRLLERTDLLAFVSARHVRTFADHPQE